MAEWRQVLGWEGLYEVSDRGEARSMTRLVLCADGSIRTYRGMSLKLQVSKDGYFYVILSRGRRRAKGFIHVMVASAFVGPKPADALTLHADDDKTANVPQNLYYGSRLNNAEDAIRNGRQVNGSHVATSKLVEADIPIIRARRAVGETFKSIGEAFGVTPQMVHYICSGQSWRGIAA